MSRPGHVTVELPLEEASGIVLRLAGDGQHSMSAAECDAAESGRQRIEQAIKAEKEPDMVPELELRERVAELLGAEVTIDSTFGRKVGTLEELVDHSIVRINSNGLRSNVPLGAIFKICGRNERQAA